MCCQDVSSSSNRMCWCFSSLRKMTKTDPIALEACHKSSQMLLSVQKEPTEKNDCGNSLETINDDRFLQHSKKKTEDNNNTIEAFSTTDLPLVFAKCPYCFFCVCIRIILPRIIMHARCQTITDTGIIATHFQHSNSVSSHAKL